MTTTSKDFEHYYGVSLLPFSDENTQLGELMYEKGLFTRTLEYSNETLLDLLQLSPLQRQDFERQLTSVAVNETQFPDIEIDHQFNTNEDLKIPILDLDLSGMLKLQKSVNFTLAKVTSKRLFGNLEFTLRNLVKTSETARKALRHRLIITQLFYSDSVVLKANQGMEANLNASLKVAKLKGVSLQSQNNGKGSCNYTFSGTNTCPFAAQLVKFNNF